MRVMWRNYINRIKVDDFDSRSNPHKEPLSRTDQ